MILQGLRQRVHFVSSTLFGFSKDYSRPRLVLYIFFLMGDPSLGNGTSPVGVQVTAGSCGAHSTDASFWTSLLEILIQQTWDLAQKPPLLNIFWDDAEQARLGNQHL